MKSSKCPQCGFVGWADAEFCKKCGAEVNPTSAGGASESQASESQASEAQSFQPETSQPQTYQPQRHRPTYKYYAEPEVSTSLATWSLVLGIVSFVTMGLFGVLATGGIVLGIIALVKIGQSPLQHGGKGRAVAGLVLSSISAIAVPIGIIAAIAIPNLLASARAANEGSALSSLRKIHSAEATYLGRHGTFGELNDLAYENLLEPELASGKRNGYRFTVIAVPGSRGFEVSGVPVNYGSTGTRSFFLDETGVIRAADRRGAEATKLDAPLGSDSYQNSPYRRTADRPYNYDDR